MITTRMPYKRYKERYPDCETVPGTYNKGDRSIEVYIPDGRMKPSGTRGKGYKWLTFTGTENATGRAVRIVIKSISTENAIKRLPRDCTWDI